ncbi:type I methionyl aminopeptidase [Chloroflexota bacterium]
MAIVIKSPREIEIMRRAGRVVGEVLEILCEQAIPGIMTSELDRLAELELRNRGAEASFKGYNGYPANICVSVNDEIVHGIPGNRRLEEGDIVSIDIGSIVEGFQGDGAATIGVGKVSQRAERLMSAAKGALFAGINAVRSGLRIGDISAAIQVHAESNGFSVVREYTGHGVGREMHEDPQVPNFGRHGEGIELCEGMTLALEPMINVGTWRTRIARNKWTVLTADGELSAHFEHTIAITDNGAEILTEV